MRKALLRPCFAIGLAGLSGFPAQAREMPGHPALIAASRANSTLAAHPDMAHRQRHHPHFVGLFPFGFVDGDVGYPVPAAISPESSAVASAAPTAAAPDPDRPPCHEVSQSGVVVDRGLGCRRTGH
jgi:hypothetical protein